MRKISLLVSLLVIIYGVSVISLFTIINEILTVSSIIVSFIRHKKEKRLGVNENVDSI